MVKKKRVHRLYRDEGLTVRIPRRRKRASHLRIVPPMPMTANVQGTMDVAKDMLLDGRRFRALTMVGTYTRECQIIAVDAGVTGTKIVAALARAGPFLRSRLAYIRGAGQTLRLTHMAAGTATGGRSDFLRSSSCSLCSLVVGSWPSPFSRSIELCLVSCALDYYLDRQLQNHRHLDTLLPFHRLCDFVHSGIPDTSHTYSAPS